jgi:hypothetical protein
MFRRDLLIRGMSRYLDRRELHVKPMILIIWSWTRMGVLKNKNWDVFVLMSIPEIVHKV